MPSPRLFSRRRCRIRRRRTTRTLGGRFVCGSGASRADTRGDAGRRGGGWRRCSLHERGGRGGEQGIRRSDNCGGDRCGNRAEDRRRSRRAFPSPNELLVDPRIVGGVLGGRVTHSRCEVREVAVEGVREAADSGGALGQAHELILEHALAAAPRLGRGTVLTSRVRASRALASTSSSVASDEIAVPHSTSTAERSCSRRWSFDNVGGKGADDMVGEAGQRGGGRRRERRAGERERERRLLVAGHPGVPSAQEEARSKAGAGSRKQTTGGYQPVGFAKLRSDGRQLPRPSLPPVGSPPRDGAGDTCYGYGCAATFPLVKGRAGDGNPTTRVRRGGARPPAEAPRRRSRAKNGVSGRRRTSLLPCSLRVFRTEAPRTVHDIPKGGGGRDRYLAHVSETARSRQSRARSPAGPPSGSAEGAQPPPPILLRPAAAEEHSRTL